MPAKSKQQQKFFGVVKAMQKGDIPKKGEAGEVADDMDKKEIDKMASTKHKGLPKKIKEIIEEELQALNEVKPFVDNRLRTKYDYPKGNRDGLVYLATNDNRYPTEIVLYNQKRDVFHFVYSHSGEFTAGNTKTQTVPRKGFNSTHYVMPYFEEWEEDLGYERGFYEGRVNEADRTSSISKQRAKAELKQQLKGKRADGLGDYTAIVYGMDGNDRVPLKSMDDINKYSKFEIGDNEDALKEAKLPDEGFSDPDQMREAKSAKSLKMDYEKAIKKEQALSSLMLLNLQKYKAAKASGDEKAIAKFTKIAGDLSPKKKKASELASAAYQAYEDKISGMHADVELSIDEANDDDIRFDLVMSDEAYDELYELISKYVEDPDDVEKELDSYDEGGFDQMSNVVTANLDRDPEYKAWKKKYGIRESVNENTTDAPRYKKYVAKAFEDIIDAMFNFRHAMGVKQLTNKDMKLKNKFESIHQALFDLQKDMRSRGLTEASIPKFKTPYEAFKWIMNKREEAMDIEMDMLQKTKDIIQTQKDMEQEASPEGGPTTDRYGAVLEKLQMEHDALRKQFAAIMAEIDEYDQGINY